MLSLIHQIKNMLTNKKTMLQWFGKMKETNTNREAYCFGFNKEGVRCPRALDCRRYTNKEIETKTYINFPEGYDIKNCEIFSPVNFPKDN